MPPEFSNGVGEPETTHVKMGLKEMIRTKHLENGTELPKIEIREPEPPKPVSAVTLYTLNSCFLKSSV